MHELVPVQKHLLSFNFQIKGCRTAPETSKARAFSIIAGVTQGIGNRIEGCQGTNALQSDPESYGPSIRAYLLQASPKRRTFGVSAFKLACNRYRNDFFRGCCPCSPMCSIYTAIFVLYLASKGLVAAPGNEWSLPG